MRRDTLSSTTATSQPRFGPRSGNKPVGGHVDAPLSTRRQDFWQMGPLLTLLGFGTFVVYVTFRAFHGLDYYAAPYLSPFYSPLVYANPEYFAGSPTFHSLMGNLPEGALGIWDQMVSWLPVALPLSPAFFILMFPASFRGTCYYYRKAYYRSVVGSPAGCTVCPLAQGTYHGETKLLLIQNLHRYAMYGAVAFIFILGYDFWLSMWMPVDGSGAMWISNEASGNVPADYQFGFGVGSLVMLLNVVFLGGYTFGCHSWRHVVGGRLNRFASGDGSTGLSYLVWKGSTWLNERHMPFAWISLFWVMFTDLYVLAVCNGWITDLNSWSMSPVTGQ